MPGLEPVKSTRISRTESAIKTGPVSSPKNNAPTQAQQSAGGRLVNAAADNFPRILDLVGDIVSIQKMKVQSQIDVREIEEKRKTLLAEADAYVQKKNADTRSFVERINAVRLLMNDFYQNCGNQQLTSEDFCKVITEIVNQMDKADSNG